MGLRKPGGFSIVCKCGISYKGKMGPTIADRCKEHELYIGLTYCTAAGHVPDFQSASVLLSSMAGLLGKTNH